MVSSCAVKAGLDLNASLIVSFTVKGFTAFQLAKYRPRPLVLAITRNKQTAMYCDLGYGVKSVLVEDSPNADEKAIIKKYFPPSQ